MRSEVEKKIVGNVIHDSYGRVYGRIIGLAVTAASRRSVPDVLIERCDGEFSSQSSSRILVVGDSMELKTSWKARAVSLRRDLKAILRREAVLRELHEEGELVEEAYEAISKKYEAERNNLVKRGCSLKREAEIRLEQLDSQAEEISFFLTGLKLDQHLGEVNEGTYKETSQRLFQLLSQASKEREEVEEALHRLNDAAAPPKSPTEHGGEKEGASIHSLMPQIEEASS